MGSGDGDDNRTFKVNFTEEGVSNLRETVRDKLKEFMGDYTDDTLVEYVMVLLRNGRRKDEAKNELDVFLGDDSDSFVAWLWDHLGSHLDLYVQASDAYTGKVATTKSKMGDQNVENDHNTDSRSGQHVENIQKNQHRRAWNYSESDVTRPPPLKSFVVSNIDLEERTNHEVGRLRSSSPERQQHRKRRHPDEQQHAKRDVVSQANNDAPRRLLQFAVRDAVGTPKPSGVVREPSFKRLRSVVSTSSGDTPLEERTTRSLQSVARVPNTMATVIKAVKEAAEDAQKVKSGRSVFDRLGRNNASEPAEQVADFKDSSMEDGEYARLQLIKQRTFSNSHQRNEYGVHARNVGMLGSGNGLASDALSKDEGYYDVDIVGRNAMGISQRVTAGGNNLEEPPTVQYSVAEDSDNIMHRARNNLQAQTTPAVNPSHDTSGVSVNVHTWKAPSYQRVEVASFNIQKPIQQIEAKSEKPDIRLMKEKNDSVSFRNENVTSGAFGQKESRRTVTSVAGPYSAGRPLEDADSRTIFVSNVHFAATKDSLSRHFNKFGEVLKVTINTGAATGQPIGSAYVEFMRKEAADNALSLDGTSFMSRILKVVKRSSAHLEANNSTMTWPRATRGSPYITPRYSRAPFPRGIAGGMRPGLSVKPGVRSMQWKRDAQAAPAETVTAVMGNNVITPTARSLTYIRTEPKSDGNSNAT